MIILLCNVQGWRIWSRHFGNLDSLIPNNNSNLYVPDSAE